MPADPWEVFEQTEGQKRRWAKARMKELLDLAVTDLQRVTATWEEIQALDATWTTLPPDPSKN